MSDFVDPSLNQLPVEFISYAVSAIALLLYGLSQLSQGNDDDDSGSGGGGGGLMQPVASGA